MLPVEQIDLQEQLTPDFKMLEFLESDAAKRLGIDMHNPPAEIVTNIRKTALKVQEARDIWGIPVVIHNCWRPLELNRALGSRDTSAHVEALAADLALLSMANQQAFDKLSAHPTFMLDVDQLIIERGCVHMGLPCKASGYQPRRELRSEAWIDGARHYPLIRIWKAPHV